MWDSGDHDQGNIYIYQYLILSRFPNSLVELFSDRRSSTLSAQRSTFNATATLTISRYLGSHTDISSANRSETTYSCMIYDISRNLAVFYVRTILPDPSAVHAVHAIKGLRAVKKGHLSLALRLVKSA